VKRKLLAAAILLAGWLFNSAAQSPPASPTCKSRTAQATTIESINAEYPRWRGKCVKIQGIDTGYRAYADRHALLEQANVWDDTKRSLLLMRNAGSTMPARRPRLAEYVGKVGSCRDQNDAILDLISRTNQIMMVGGFCHTSEANYIVVASSRTLSSEPVLRLTEAEVPEPARQLRDMPVGFPGRKGALMVARRTFMAAVARDRMTLTGLFEPDLAEERQSHPEDADKRLEIRARDARHRFNELMGSFPFRRPAGDPKLFIDASELAEPDTDYDTAPSVACWCKSGDCSGKWPVIRRDADNDHSRPYYCIATSDFLVYRAGRWPWVEIPTPNHGFAEPRW
jgi:hypothetical protein